MTSSSYIILAFTVALGSLGILGLRTWYDLYRIQKKINKREGAKGSYAP